MVVKKRVKQILQWARRNKKIVIPLIVVLILGIISTQSWLEVTMGSFSPGSPLNHHFQIRLSGRLIITETYRNHETGETTTISRGRFLSPSQLLEIISLARRRIDEESISVFGGIRVNIRILWRSHDFYLMFSGNEHLDELVSLLIEYSPIEVFRQR